VTLAARAGANAILAITHEGRTARLLAARRPTAPVYAITESPEVARRLSLWWGVAPIVDPLSGDGEAIATRVVEALRRRGALATPARVVVVSASPDLAKSGANVLRIRQV
jgi:pyruvate kinase